MLLCRLINPLINSISYHTTQTGCYFCEIFPMIILSDFRNTIIPHLSNNQEFRYFCQCTFYYWRAHLITTKSFSIQQILTLYKLGLKQAYVVTFIYVPSTNPFTIFQMFVIISCKGKSCSIFHSIAYFMIPNHYNH